MMQWYSSIALLEPDLCSGPESSMASETFNAHQIILWASAETENERSKKTYAGCSNPVTKILELQENQEVAVIGTLYKEMKLKPSILDEYNKVSLSSMRVGLQWNVHACCDISAQVRTEFSLRVFRSCLEVAF